MICGCVLTSRRQNCFYQGETDYASKLFENNEWKATAAYRSGDYEKAAEQFAQKRAISGQFQWGPSSGIFRTITGCN
ncbi:MAG: hypothetical protein CM1200mP30_30560 [Pseudomonadota bacterium]|nr:MAG: hypothetical protein CM1200mP30_30560 [Pseudomonadota bacterium]